MLCERLDLGQLCIAHDGENPLKVAPACIGEAERARRAQEQRRPHALLHQRKLAADRRLGKAEQAAGRVQGAALHDFYEERHSGEINSVCFKYGTLEFQMPVYCSGRSELKFRSSSTSINTSQAMSAKSYTKTRFSANDAALVLIDHQSGIMQFVHDYSPAEFRNNVIALAKLGKVFNLPTVLTTSFSQGPNGPFIPEVVSMYLDAPLTDRLGIISAWDDPAFVAAIEKTGRKNLIMAGVTVDVCLAFAAMQAVEAGYDVYGVIDASGGLEVTIRENAVARMRDHGITPINWTTVAAELQRDWRLPTGQELGRVFHDHYHSYGLLMDSFESVTANAVKKAS
jgi:nicotinamidase-related amidase